MSFYQFKNDYMIDHLFSGSVWILTPFSGEVTGGKIDLLLNDFAPVPLFSSLPP